MDESLYNSIKQRARTVEDQSETGLLSEVDDLMKETHALIDEQGGRVSASGSPKGGDATWAELQKVMAVLKQKEDDLELAAKIGDALFKENTQLRKDTENATILREANEALQAKIQALESSNSSLSRKVDFLSRNIAEADTVNESLTESVAQLQVQNTEFERQLRAKTEQLTAQAETIARHASVSSVDSPLHKNGAADQHDFEAANLAVETVKAEADAAIAKLKSELDQEQQLRSSSVDHNKQLRQQVASLKEQLFDQQQDDQVVEELRQQINHLTNANLALEEDLEETRELLNARAYIQRRTSSMDSGNLSVGSPASSRMESPNHISRLGVNSLEAELSRAGGEEEKEFTPSTPTSTPKQSTQQSHDEIDPYYFHFHMTAMSVKALLSQRGSTGSVVSAHAMNALNELNTRELYQEVVEKAIPPHQWMNHVRDAYCEAYLKSLSSNGAAKESGHAIADTSGQPKLPRTPADDVARKGTPIMVPGARASEAGRQSTSASTSTGGRSFFSKFVKAISEGISSPSKAPTPRGQRSYAQQHGVTLSEEQERARRSSTGAAKENIEYMI